MSETPEQQRLPQSGLDRQQQNRYQPPQLVPIGKATDLLQGGSGKHTDSYSGYYWNQEN